MDRVATRTDPLGASESFLYDPAGNLTRRTDRKGQVSTFVYDALNRLTTASYTDGSGVSYRYDGGDRLVGVDDSAGGALTNTFDTLDRPLSQSTTLGTVAYAYDALGRRTELTVPGLAPTTYGYDENSRLKQIVRGTQATAVDYDDAGRRTVLTLPNGVSTQYQYDTASRLTALVYQNVAGLLGDLTYQYDAGGNRVRIGGSFARTLLPEAVAGATYDGANRQLAFGTKQMTFDANGNLTTISGASPTGFTWDARDRLVGLEQQGTLASFNYAFGRRVGKTVNGATTRFVYDGLDVAQQLESQRTTSYLRSLAIDEAFGLTNPDGTFFLTSDALGSPISVRDGAGSAVNDYTYDPFGTVSATNPAFANPFQFTGRENDDLGGLYYYRARHYHPQLHRFISEDPFRVLDPNLYAYVFNNPSADTDPLGLYPPWLQKAAQVAAILLGFALNPGTVPPPQQLPGIEQPSPGPGGGDTQNVPRPGAPRQTGPKPIGDVATPDSPTGPRGPGGPGGSPRTPTVRSPLPVVLTGVGPILAGIGTGIVIVLYPSDGNAAELEWCAARGRPRCIGDSKSNR